MKEYTYKNFNQYNYSVLALRVNYTNKTLEMFYGGACPIGYDKKTSKKEIRRIFEELKECGFKVIKGDR